LLLNSVTDMTWSPSYIATDLICHRFNCHRYGLSPISPVSVTIGY